MHYRILCKVNLPKEVQPGIIHNTIIVMQNSLTLKDENNRVSNNFSDYKSLNTNLLPYNIELYFIIFF